MSTASEKQLDWQAPPFEAGAEKRQGWIEENLQEGNGWLSGQKAYTDIARNIRIFDAIFDDKTKSSLVSNSLKYNIRKFVETIADVREIGSYSSDAAQFKAYANIENKVAKAIYLESQFPRSIRKALQYSTVLGRGYIWPKCKTLDYGFGERRIIFEPLGPLDVVPTQIPSTNDVQDAYTNTIFEYMPVAEAHGRFPLFQSQLIPVDSMNYGADRVGARRADYAEKIRYGEVSRNWGNLYCEIRYTFIRDIRINNTGKELPMGDFGTSWFYTVPFIGQDIFGGIRNGQKVMRKAKTEDCRVYPYLRLMISVRGMKTPMYDGPAFDWSGVMPPVQYDVDDWAWEGMGRSLVQDVGSIEVTKRKHERKMDQVISTKLNPPLGYDRTSTGGPKIENFDMFAQDMRMGLDGKPQDVLQSILPDSVTVEEVNFKFLEYLGAMEKEQLGINDIGNLENLKFSIGGGDLDKALEPIGPIAKGIAAGMEASNAKIAYQVKFHIPQWMDTKRVIEYVGPDNITQDVYDFDPASMIPSHMPDEWDGEHPPTTPSNYGQVERARRFAKNLRLISIPSTLLRMTQKDEQLKWITLKKQGAPISWATTLAKVGIENYGEVPGNTEREKYINEKQEELKLAAQLAKEMAALGLQPPEGPGQGKGGGRPNTNKNKPNVKQKGGAGGQPRTTLTTS